MKLIQKSIHNPVLDRPESHFLDEESGFSIVAAYDGVYLQGKSPVIADREELDSFAKAVATAWTQHERMRNSLREKLSGR